jgi:replication factor A1
MFIYLASKHFISFKVDCIVTDGNDIAIFLMVGKTAENFFGSFAHCYLYDKGVY